MTTLLCPKCMNPMRQYERNRVVVDQCTECGGLFLDRGELEALAAAERAYYGDGIPGAAAPVSPPPPLPPLPPQPGPIYDDRRYDDRGFREHGFTDRRYDDRRYEGRSEERRPSYDGSYGKTKKRKARSFLEELFDD